MNTELSIMSTDLLKTSSSLQMRDNNLSSSNSAIQEQKRHAHIYIDIDKYIYKK